MGHSRIQELDDIKSSLVLIMLVFHSASGLTRHAETLAPICSALFFIHYAFLMVTGLLCGIHYGAEAQTDARQVKRRLWSRGAKLLGLFLGINLLFYGVRILQFVKLQQALAQEGGLLQLVWAPAGSLVAFEILYFIALFLLLVPFLIPWARDWMLFIIGFGLMFWNHSTLTFCLSWAVLGMGLGMFVRRPAVIPRLRFLGGYVFCFPILLPVMLWLNSSRGAGDALLNKLFLLVETLVWFGFFVWLLRIHDCGRHVRVLGAYTLVAYMGQMFIIVGLNTFLRRLPWGAVPSYLVMLLTATVTTYLAVRLLAWGRRKFHLVDRFYQLIFT